MSGADRPEVGRSNTVAALRDVLGQAINRVLTQRCPGHSRTSIFERLDPPDRCAYAQSDAAGKQAIEVTSPSRCGGSGCLAIDALHQGAMARSSGRAARACWQRVRVQALRGTVEVTPSRCRGAFPNCHPELQQLIVATDT